MEPLALEFLKIMKFLYVSRRKQVKSFMKKQQKSILSFVSKVKGMAAPINMDIHVFVSYTSTYGSFGSYTYEHFECTYVYQIMPVKFNFKRNLINTICFCFDLYTFQF